ncbi:MAG: FAD-dependent oxidoreductase [Erythrobacter sp.]
MTQTTIIGGGIAGLVCAALAHARGHEVTVIEAGLELGGLWKSSEVALGGYRLALDAGLRLPVATGEARLDDAIFHRPDFAFAWDRFEGWPREGAICAGRFNPENSCLDAGRLNARLADVVAEMRQSSPAPSEPATARDHAVAWYGPTLADGLVRDAVLGLFETELEALAPQAVRWFVPRRVILGDHEATARLLADPRLEGRVAHARHQDIPQATSRPFLQPRGGGVSTWVRALHASLERAGVRFILGDGVAAIAARPAPGAVDRLVLRSGVELAVDQLISTLAPGLILRALGAPTGAVPQFRHLRISHVLVDRAPDHKACYGLNFNRHPAFFRVIFHDNLSALPEGAHVLTFEHLIDDTDRPDIAAAALEECRRSGAMPAETRLLTSDSDLYRNAMAVPLLAHVEEAARQHAALLAPLRNLRFVGRAASGAAFLDQIIREADAAISAIEEEAGCPGQAA